MTAVSGIDVGEANLDVSVSRGPVVRFDNSASGITKLLQRLQDPDTVPAACGPTGGCERRLTSRPHPSEIAVPVDHPGRVRAFAEACVYEAKTDPPDAQVLARHAAVFPEADTREPATDPHRQEMKDLLPRRRQFIDQRVQEKSRLDQGVSATIPRSTQRHIAWPEKETDRLDQEYQAVHKDNPTLAERVDLYCSVPGVGPLSAPTLVTHPPELGLWDSKALTSLAGLAPWSRDSGKERGHRAGKGGCGLVRRTLYMGAWAVIRHDREMRCFYDRPRQRGKPGNVAVVPVMRKSLLQLNTVAGKGTPWALQNSTRSPRVTPRWLDIQHGCSTDRRIACRLELPGCVASAAAEVTIQRTIGSGSERVSSEQAVAGGNTPGKSDAWPLDAPATQAGNFETP